MNHLLDTNTATEPLRPRLNAGLIARLQQRDDETAVPTPVWHELRFGCRFLPHLTVIPTTFDRDSWNI